MARHFILRKMPPNTMGQEAQTWAARHVRCRNSMEAEFPAQFCGINIQISPKSETA
jgi:hypothetical protein